MKVLQRPGPSHNRPAPPLLKGEVTLGNPGGKPPPELPVNWSMTATAATFDEVHVALFHGQFQPYFQPILGLGDTKGVIGAEALLRWQHPRHGLLRADQFLAVIDEAGLLVDVDVMTVHQVEADMAHLEAAGGQMPRWWLNTSVSDIFSDRFVEAVGSTAARGGRLGVEVPQMLLAINEASVCRRLTSLRDQGVAIAVDRFGSETKFMGRHCPLDVLSVDPVLIQRLDCDAEARRLVSVVVKFAHGEEMSVVAKGVEKPEQFNILQDLGCNGAQGYLIGKPVPMATLLLGDLSESVSDVTCTWWG